MDVIRDEVGMKAGGDWKVQLLIGHMEIKLNELDLKSSYILTRCNHRQEVLVKC